MSLRNMLGVYVAFAGASLLAMEEGNKRAAKEQRERWERMLAMPRKKKKQEKKRLVLLDRILSYDPMEEIGLY